MTGSAERQRLLRLWMRLRQAWWLPLCVVAVFGAWVRYHDLSAQVVVDDEWHSLFRAASQTATTIATEYSEWATSIPVNLFHKALLKFWGWSEVSIRLLSVVATLTTLFVFPWLVFRLFGSKRMALLVAVLFACSPFWIFYAMSARPYAVFFLLLLVAYHALYRLLTVPDASASAVLVFAVSGALAVYFHLYALPALAFPALLVLWKIALAARREGFRGAEPRRLLQRALAGFGLWTTLVVALFWPAALHGVDLPPPVADAFFGKQFAREAVELLTGSRYPALAWLLFACALVGTWVAVKRNRTFMTILALGLLGSAAFTLKLRPTQFEVAIVTWRYNISVFMLYIVGLAAGFDAGIEYAWRWLGSRLRRWPERSSQVMVVAVLGALLVFASPIPRSIASRPNNFRLHSAYQESYSGWDPSHKYVSAFFGSATRGDDEIPEPYSQLGGRAGACRIMEYPTFMGDHESAYYFYQLHHHCDVVMGYSRADLIGTSLHAEEHASRLRFQHLADVEDVAGLAARKVDFVMVHVDSRAELAKARRPKPSRETRRVLRSLRKRLGKPVASDRWVQLFQVGAQDSGVISLPVPQSEK
jgi:hypothetical protein